MRASPREVTLDADRQALLDAWGRVLSRVTVDAETGCWRSGHCHGPDGYARVEVRGYGMARAHRVAYAAENGVSLSELRTAYAERRMTIDHLHAAGCRHRDCVRPKHLRLVTSRENTLASGGPAAQNARKTHCPRGHHLAGENLVRAHVRRGWRECLTCQRARTRVWNMRLRGLDLTLDAAIAAVLAKYPAMAAAALATPTNRPQKEANS